MGVRNEAISFPGLLFAVFYKLKLLHLLLKHFVLQTMRSDFERPWYPPTIHQLVWGQGCSVLMPLESSLCHLQPKVL